MKLRHIHILVVLFVGIILFAPLIAEAKLDRIEISEGHRGFIHASSGEPFTPWGFNYDRDYKMRLIEEYWDAEWPTIAGDFREMKELGANVVRIHLQFAKFMDAPDKPNKKYLKKLKQLLSLAEKTGVYLDVTALVRFPRRGWPLGRASGILGSHRSHLRKEPRGLLL